MISVGPWPAIRSPISLELGELAARREADVAVGERVRPRDAAGDRDSDRDRRRRAMPRARQPADPEHGGERDRDRGGRVRLALHPGRPEGGDQRAAGEDPERRTAAARARGGAGAQAIPADGGDQRRPRSATVGQQLVVGSKPEVAASPDPGELERVERPEPGCPAPPSRRAATTSGGSHRPRRAASAAPGRDADDDRGAGAERGADPDPAGEQHRAAGIRIGSSQRTAPALSTAISAVDGQRRRDQPGRGGAARASARTTSAAVEAISAAAAISLTPPQR